MRRLAVGILVLAVWPGVTLIGQGKRPLIVDDLFNVRDVRDPQRSPDGKWVAYTVTRAVKDTDKNDTDVWMVSWDGAQQLRLTQPADSISSPRWSPDGRYLAYLGKPAGDAHDGQLDAEHLEHPGA